MIRQAKLPVIHFASGTLTQGQAFTPRAVSISAALAPSVGYPYKINSIIIPAVVRPQLVAGSALGLTSAALQISLMQNEIPIWISEATSETWQNTGTGGGIDFWRSGPLLAAADLNNPLTHISGQELTLGISIVNPYNGTLSILDVWLNAVPSPTDGEIEPAPGSINYT